MEQNGSSSERPRSNRALWGSLLVGVLLLGLGTLVAQVRGSAVELVQQALALQVLTLKLEQMVGDVREIKELIRGYVTTSPGTRP